MKVLAIIKQVEIGVGDYGQAALWFSAYTSERCAALQIFGWEQAKAVIEAAGVRSVLSLEGRSCWVEEGDGMIRFIEMAKI